jgi:hypothetical protein
METIRINVTGEEFEVISLDLTTEEVQSLYNFRQTYTKKIEELTKQLEQEKKNHEYTRNSLSDASSELGEGHTLLTALGIKDKTDHEESYYRKDLKIATRIALYIAANK